MSIDSKMNNNIKIFTNIRFHNFRKTNSYELISLSFFTEDNKLLYVINKDAKLLSIHNNEFLRNNVLKHIFNYYSGTSSKKYSYWNIRKIFKKYGRTKKQIKKDILNFIKDNKYNKNIQLYSYYSEYNSIMINDLFDTIGRLPKPFNPFVISLKQMLYERNMDEEHVMRHSNKPNDISSLNSVELTMWYKQMYFQIINEDLITSINELTNLEAIDFTEEILND